MTGTKLVTIICWIVSALVLTGLLIWLVTSVIFGSWGFFNNFNVFNINIGGFENLTGPFESRGVQMENANDVRSININWVAGDVTVIPYDGEEVKITEFAQRELRNNEQMHVSNTNGVLRINFRERGNHRGRMPRKNLEVFVPQSLSKNLADLTINSTSGSIEAAGFETSSLSISTVSASIKISDIVSSDITAGTTSGSINAASLRAGRLNASSVSGAINISDANVPTVDVSTTSGAISLAGTLDVINTSTISGGVSIRSSTVPGRIDSSSVSGGVNVYIPNEGEITVSHSAVSGRFSSDVPVIMQSNANYNFSSVSGSTNIHAIGGE